MSQAGDVLILNKSEVKRLAVYVMHDKDGHIDEYIDVFLKGLRSEVSHLRVVINGSAGEEGLGRIRAIADEVIERPNEGYDITAYREGLLARGYEDLCTYDEAVICNDTLYGPIHPFAEMFGAMAEKDVDFWGITAFHGAPFDPFGTISYGYLPKHIQSFFQVFRKDFMRTDDFRKWWEDMPPITRYEDAIGTHEAVFTKAMEDRGYRWAVYCDGDAMSAYTWDPLRDFPRYCMETLKCPVMKKRTFYHDYMEAFERSGGEAAREAFEYIKYETEYDARLIVKNLIRTCNMADLRKRLGLTYIVPAEIDRTGGMTDSIAQGSGADRDTSSNMADGQQLKTALILHIYYDELAEECAEYASHMPEGIDIFVTVPDERKRSIVEPHFDEIKKTHRVEFRISGNRGRDVAPFLVTCKDIVMNYDLVLKIHDKKVKQIPLLSIGRAWEYLCFECLLPTETYVKNVIKLFCDHPDLGLLCPPVPLHGPYFPTTGRGEWGDNFSVTKETADKLGIHAPMDENCEPVAPLGSEFWVRTKALKVLFDHDWQYDEFPEEPVGIDGTVMHAIERLYPFAAQSEGYYSAWILSDSYARIHMDNWAYMNNGLARAEAERTGGYRPFRELLSRTLNS